MLSAFKNFLVTFLVGAILFGVIGYFTTGYVSGIVSGILDGESDKLDSIIHNTPEDTDNKDNGPTVDPNLKVPEGNSFTFVIVGTDYRPDVYKNYYNSEDDIKELVDGKTSSEDSVGILDTSVRYINATWITLVRADKENREFVSCYISPETRVKAPSGYTTLGDVYGRYGISVLCDYISAMTGLNIDYNFIIDGINGEDFLSQMGSVKFDLATDIYSGGKYHISASTSIVEVEPEETTADSETTEKPKDDPKESEESTDEGEEEPVETEIVENVFVLGSGKQSLSSYSLHILNTFKEMSAGDIDIKSAYILSMVKSYLLKCAEWSEADLTQKMMDITRERYYDEDGSKAPWGGSNPLSKMFDDPYGSKPVLATNLSYEKVADIYSMLDAIEYFSYTEMIYPGTYSETENRYIPDITSAVELFSKYKAD